MDEKVFEHANQNNGEVPIHGTEYSDETFSPMRFYSEFVTKSIPFEMYNAANDWRLYRLVQATT